MAYTRPIHWTCGKWNALFPNGIVGYYSTVVLESTQPGDLWRHGGGLGKEILMPYPINQRAQQFNLFSKRRDVSLMYLNNFTINKWEDLLLGRFYNAVIAKKRKSALMNALTVFGEERCRQSKRKLDVLVRCMVGS